LSPGPEPSRRQQRHRPRTRRGRLLADLQTRLDDALAELKIREKTIAELAQTFDAQRSLQIDLERRLTALEASYQEALDELRANRQRHEQHLTRLDHSVERHKHAVNELERILNAHEH
jgi:chromosome segregation ATPase